ncbi:MAG: PIN domain-containing protein [Fimbriiglobus sp.]|jgi:predicted nucleic acid-binding protein|nr:PIN domain-containing protein [Fimbriiglobus sp.]
MKVLIDSNILLREAEPSHPMHADAVAALGRLLARGAQLHLVSQNFYELWVALTRPIAVNGLGKTTAEAGTMLGDWEKRFTVLDDTPAVRAHWFHLVTTHAVSGKNAHDARLVAAMLAHGLTHLLTFNDADFLRFTTIVTLTPLSVLAAP